MHRGGAWGSCLALLSLLFLLVTTAHGCGDNASPWSFQLPASSRTIPAQFSVDIEGTSTDGLYSISIKANAGTLNQNGETLNVVVANQIPYSDNLVLFDLYGTNSQIILTSWAYCRSGALTALYLESTRGNSGFTPSDISGNCTVTQEVASPTFQTQSECLQINPVSNVPTISGDNSLSLRDGSPGSVALGSEDFNVLPYAIVNCVNCPADARGGWVEVHTVLAAKATADVCLGIFYLFVKCRSTATLQYVQCFQGNETSQDINAGYDLTPTIGAQSQRECCIGAECQDLNNVNASSVSGVSSSISSTSSASSTSSSSSSSASSVSLATTFSSGVSTSSTTLSESSSATTSATPTPSAHGNNAAAGLSGGRVLDAETLYILAIFVALLACS